MTALIVAVVLVFAFGALVYGLPRDAPPPRPVPDQAFRSASSPNEPAVVWAVGDGANGSHTARAVARRIAGDRPNRVLYLGDVYERGTADDFRKGYNTVYGALTSITAPTPGNHDWPAHPDGYDPYWQSRTGAATPPWYSFRIGGWRILSLNSEAPHDRGSAQLKWLERTLAREHSTCILAFWHRPLQSAGRHGDQDDVEPLWNALRGHAKLVVNGHDHDLQRLRPRDGITQLVTGAGGKSHYKIDFSDRRVAFGEDRHDGALRIDLRPGGARLAFVGVDGASFDRSAVRCSPGPR